MNDLAQLHRTAIDDEWNAAPDGRHAFDEDAAATPIFSALRRGARPRRRLESAPDPVDEFRRDPLTAPIPVQAFIPAPTRSADRGRHHRT